MPDSANVCTVPVASHARLHTAASPTAPTAASKCLGDPGNQPRGRAGLLGTTVPPFPGKAEKPALWVNFKNKPTIIASIY